MYKTIFFIIITTFLYSATMAQGKQPVLLTRKKCTIPFELTAHNNIVVKMVLNKKDTVNLMLHTAESDVTLTEKAMHNIHSVQFAGKVNDVKSWGGANNSSRFSENNTLQIGDMRWNNVTVWEDENSGQGTDGKIGLNLFDNKMIAIDYDKKLLTISPRLPRNIQRYQKCALLHKREDLFVEATCGTGSDTCKNMFLIHSGYSGDILLDDKFVADHHLGEELQVTGEKDLKDSYGHIIKTKRAVLPVFAIGTDTLAAVPAGFFEGAIGRQKISIIGADILKRFNVVIDAKRQYIYLQPNSLTDAEYAKA